MAIAKSTTSLIRFTVVEEAHKQIEFEGIRFGKTKFICLV